MSTELEGERALRATLVSAFQRAVRGVDLAALTERAVQRSDLREAGFALIAVGKAAAAMAAGALAARTGPGGPGLVIIPPGTADRGLARVPGVSVLRGAHPVPDRDSAAAGAAALALARGLTAADRLLVLVSGGASSLMATPPPDLSVATMPAAMARLLRAGASVEELNLVRRHLSIAHGGALREATAARVVTLVASDVIGGALHDVGSGPSLVDPSTLEQARAVLRARAPDLLRTLGRHLRETPKTMSGEGGAEVVAGPETLAQAVAAELRASGLAVELLPAEAGPAKALVRRRTASATGLAPATALVLSSEPTLAVPSYAGDGGRAGWVALATALDLPPGVAFLAGASDGVDGATDSAGACVTHAAVVALGEARALEALVAFEDGPFHAAAGTAIDLGGPSGLNLTDVHVLART